MILALVILLGFGVFVWALCGISNAIFRMD